MDCWFDNEHRNLRRQIRAWVKNNLGPGDHGQGNLEINACRLANQLGQDGFMAYAVPSRFGGVRETVQARDLCLIREELAWGSALADVMFGVQALGSYPIALAGSEEQQRRYLPPLAKGERIAAFALTEPNAGSDVSAISTQAERATSGYRLNGVKHFISNAGIAHTYVVFASTQPQAKAKGLSAFIVESNSAGFTVKEKTPRGIEDRPTHPGHATLHGGRRCRRFCAESFGRSRGLQPKSAPVRACACGVPKDTV